MKLNDIVSLFKSKRKKQKVISFTGGMGAQIISAAVYFLMQKTGKSVYADLSYFDLDPHVAEEGNPGDCSHWGWQLDSFGLTPASFDSSPDINERTYEIIHDGPQKFELGLEALAQLDIRRYFEVPVDVSDVLPVEFLEGFLCIHVRRGDYVNVASHLVPDEGFIELAKQCSGLLNNVIVLSDSPIKNGFKEAISSHFKSVSFLDNIDPFTAHRLMRCARILICSNSQFSLVAAMLNQKALKFIPKQWFGENESLLEKSIISRCQFQVIGKK